VSVSVSAFVPDVVIGAIRSIVSTMRPEAQWPVFSMLFALYVFIAIKLFSYLWCWLDYLLATGLRRCRLSPLPFQYPIGDFLEAAPRWAARVGFIFVLTTIAWAATTFWLKPARDSALEWFQIEWGRILRALWS
jgi:hypothetical protein